MMCQLPNCAKPGELACTLGGTSRRVICIDHQVRMRTAALMGGRSITIHHGVDLDTWHGDQPAVEDVPDLGLPHSQPQRSGPTFPPAHEYDRGRTDERASIVEYLRRWEPGLARAIGRGDHMEGK